MTPMMKGIAVALIQILIVCSLGAKLLYDRSTRPQAWFKTQRYDPNLPIRGRYVSLQIEVNDSRPPEDVERRLGNQTQVNECGSIAMRDGSPVAVFDEGPVWNCDNLTFTRWKLNAQGMPGNASVAGSESSLRLAEPLLFFIPDTARDPSRLATGEELWVLATIPGKGPPRPIALGVKKAGEKDIRPLSLN